MRGQRRERRTLLGLGRVFYFSSHGVGVLPHAAPELNSELKPSFFFGFLGSLLSGDVYE